MSVWMTRLGRVWLALVILWLAACLLSALGCASPTKATAPTTSCMTQEQMYGIVRQAVRDEIIEYHEALDRKRAKRREELRQKAKLDERGEFKT